LPAEERGKRNLRKVEGLRRPDLRVGRNQCIFRLRGYRAGARSASKATRGNFRGVRQLDELLAARHGAGITAEQQTQGILGFAAQTLGGRDLRRRVYKSSWPWRTSSPGWQRRADAAISVSFKPLSPISRVRTAISSSLIQLEQIQIVCGHVGDDRRT